MEPAQSSGQLGSEVPVLTPGARLGHYELLEPLGEGSTGWVFASHDRRLDRRVALKVLKPGVTFTATAEALAGLTHPNVVTVHAVGHAGGHAFIVMDLVEGLTLRRWLERDARSVDEILRVFGEAGDGLRAAHAAGLVHYDFTPDNVLIDAGGQARVTDFGLARTAARVEGPSTYLAPEQLTGLPTDARTDQFSFAVALYEALYSERPFAGDSLQQLQQAVASGSVRPAPLGTDVPWRVRRPLLRALHAELPQRHRSMGALLEELRHDPEARRRRTLTTAALLCSLALAGGVCIWLLSGAHS